MAKGHLARCSTGRRGAACAPFIPMAGPAVIASIAYMDPGNFATNIQAGARYGYTSALGRPAGQPHRHAVSGAFGQARHRDRPQPRRSVPRSISRAAVSAMWVVSEIAAMATDLAEFLGGAIGLVAAFPHAAARRHGRHRHRHLRHFDLRAPRLQADRIDHRRARRHDRPLLCHRILRRAGRLGRRRLPQRACRNFRTASAVCSRSGSSARPSCRTRSICIRV